MKKIVIIVFLLSVGTMLIAQNPHIVDSLKNELEIAKEDTNKVELFLNIAWLYKFTGPDTAIHYTMEAIKLSEKIEFDNGIIGSYRNLGVINAIRDNYEEGIKYFKLGFDKCVELKDKKGQGTFLTNLGIINSKKGYYKEAEINYLDALKLYREINYKQDEDKCLNNLGLLYYKNGFYEKALEKYYESIEISKIFKNEIGTASSYTNIGNIFFKIDQLDNAEKYYLNALNLYIKNNDKRGIAVINSDLGYIKKETGNYKESIVFFLRSNILDKELGKKRHVATNYNNIGQVYIELQEYDSALYYFSKSFEINDELDLKPGLLFSYINFGGVYNDISNYQLSLKNSLQALALAKELNAREEMKTIYHNLSEAYLNLQNYKVALEYKELYIQISDSIFNEEKHKQINELELKYETVQKEKELILSKAKIEKVKLSRLYISIGSILILISLVFVYILFLKKKKAYNVLYQKSIEGVKQEKKNNECRISLARKQPDIDKQDKLYNDLIELVEYEKIHHEKGLTLEDLSKKLTTNREYLSQVINEQYGRFNDFINHYRINDTVEIFSDPKNLKSKYSLEVIAAEVGFKSLSTFITAFKKETGLTPSKFRDSRN